MDAQKALKSITEFFPQVQAEFERLEDENRQLRDRIEEISNLAHTGLTTAKVPAKPERKNQRGRRQGSQNSKGLPQFVRLQGKKFAAQVNRKKFTFHKGGFDTPEEAHQAAVEAIEKAGGEAVEKSKRQQRIADLTGERVVFWECTGCSHTDEHWRLKFTKGHPENCPKCGSTTFVKQNQKKELMEK